jgi:protein-S-isoprenylcysteine O-methyltransferase Ste14
MATGISRAGFRYVMQRYVLLALFGLCLFVAAGSWNWPRGWAVLAACFVCESVSLGFLALRAPETLNQRGLSHSGIKRFDIAFAALWLILSFSLGVVAGLDCIRYAWSSLPWSAFGLGLGLVGAATALGTWAMVENEHFEKFVRIQTDRNHRVVTTGPYRAVRHPGYVAGILGALASPLMLGSVWSTIPALLLAALFVWRTSAEDTTLQRELDGYTDYATQTPHRLIPFLW